MSDACRQLPYNRRASAPPSSPSSGSDPASIVAIKSRARQNTQPEKKLQPHHNSSLHCPLSCTTAQKPSNPGSAQLLGSSTCHIPATVQFERPENLLAAAGIAGKRRKRGGRQRSPRPGERGRVARCAGRAGRARRGGTDLGGRGPLGTESAGGRVGGRGRGAKRTGRTGRSPLPLTEISHRGLAPDTRSDIPRKQDLTSGNRQPFHAHQHVSAEADVTREARSKRQVAEIADLLRMAECEAGDRADRPSGRQGRSSLASTFSTQRNARRFSGAEGKSVEPAGMA